jgi:hypothetical protein
MLNEVKHLNVARCDSMEMFRFAQHDSATTGQIPHHCAVGLSFPGLTQHAQPVLVGDLAQRRIIEAVRAQRCDQLGHPRYIP